MVHYIYIIAGLKGNKLWAFSRGKKGKSLVYEIKVVLNICHLIRAPTFNVHF